MKSFLFAPLLLSLIFSCGNNSEKTKSLESNTFAVERHAFFQQLMEPTEVAALLQASAAEFDPKLMNNPALYSLYAGNKVKAAANMGIYLSDLNYGIAYTQPVKDYFEAAQGLSKTIGIEEETLQFLVKRYNDHLNQNDSVKKVVSDLLTKSTLDLKGTDKEKLAGIAMAAYQIENLHITLGILESYPKDMLPEDARAAILAPLFKIVLSQKSSIETTYHFFLTFSDPLDPHKNPNYLYYVKAFEELIEVYKKLNVEEKIAANHYSELMTNTVIWELNEKVTAIRSKIVSTE